MKPIFDLSEGLWYSTGWERRISIQGNPYTVWNWNKSRMPRIDDNVLDCVIYLYPTVQDAQDGVSSGGSGFLTALRSQVDGNYRYLYAITNSHVIHEGDSPVIRLNNQRGSMDIIDLEQGHWFHHPDGDDVAACMVGLSEEKHKFKFVPRDEMFITQEIIEHHKIGPGDDVFLVGRFINHEGKQRNLPSLRFGNIAMMPWEPVEHRGILQESFIVELRSIGGFSGSPVFLLIPPLTPRPGQKAITTKGYGPWLLGIDWGHIHSHEKVLDSKNRPVPGNLKIKSNTGMACVVPSWKIDELLDIREFAMHRQNKDKQLEKEAEGAVAGTTMDAKPFTREDFEDTLRKVSRSEEVPLDEGTSET